MSAVIDWADPCARANVLRDAYYRLIAGQAETSVRFSIAGGDREVRYQAADRAALFNEWRDAERACAAVLPRPNTIRFATSKGV